MVLLGSRQHSTHHCHAISWGPHIVVKCIMCVVMVLLTILKVQCIAVNVRFFIIFKEVAGSACFQLA